MEVDDDLCQKVMPQPSAILQIPSASDKKQQDGKRVRTDSSYFQDSKSVPTSKRQVVDYFSADAVSTSSEKKSSSMKRSAELKGLFCLDVDPTINTKDLLNFHFSKFGVLTQIKCVPEKNYACVKFKTHASATKAKKKGAIFSDEVPPMKLYWMEKCHRSKKKNFNSPLVKDYGTSQTLEKPMISKEEKDAKKDEVNESGRKNLEINKQAKNHPIKLDTMKKSSESDKLIEKLQLPAYSTEEKLSRLEERDKLLHMAETNEYGDVLKRKLTGTCTDMCPEKERYMRKVRCSLSVLETNMTLNSLSPNEEKFDHRFIVKEYSRSSADQQKSLPHELRPPRVLLNTMNYLICNIMDLKGNPFVSLKEWYNFLWNRTRSIRKDIAQQQLCDPICVEIMEKCTRFHILCIGELWNKPLSTFDPKINNENLTKSLQTLKHMYADLKSNGVRCPNEAEFRGYDILLSLSEGESLRLIKDLDSEIRKSSEVKFALDTALALTSRNYVRFFKLMKSATYLKRCILMRFLNQVRLEALHVIIRAFCPPNRTTTYPTSDLMENLGFESCSETADFCEELGLKTSYKSISFHKKSLNIREAMPKILKSNFLLRDKSKSIAYVVSNEIVPENPIHFYNPSNVFDEDGYLKNLTESEDIHKVWKSAGVQQGQETELLTTYTSSFQSADCLPVIDCGEKYFKTEQQKLTPPTLSYLCEIGKSADASAQFADGKYVEINPTYFSGKSEDLVNTSVINLDDESVDMIDIESCGGTENNPPTSSYASEQNVENISQDIDSVGILTSKYFDASQQLDDIQTFPIFRTNEQYMQYNANSTKQEYSSRTPVFQLNQEVHNNENIFKFPKSLQISQKTDVTVHETKYPECLPKKEIGLQPLTIVEHNQPDNSFIKPQNIFVDNLTDKETFNILPNDVVPLKDLKQIDQIALDELSEIDFETEFPSYEHVKNLFSDVLLQPNEEKLEFFSDKEPNQWEISEITESSELNVDDGQRKIEQTMLLHNQQTDLIEENYIDILPCAEEMNEYEQIEIMQQNHRDQLAKKVISRWMKFCSKRRAKQLLSSSLPAHPILGARDLQREHDFTVSPITIMRSSSEFKKNVTDEMSDLVRSHCRDFLPMLRALGNERMSVNPLRGNYTDKFWKLLIVLPEEKSDQKLLLAVKWIVSKFSADKVKLCKDGSYMLSCFNLPNCPQKVKICVYGLVLNNFNTKTIEGNSTLLYGLSAVLVCFPQSFPMEQDLNDFCDMLECLTYNINAITPSPFCLMLLGSDNKCNAIEQYLQFVEKCSYHSKVKTLSLHIYDGPDTNLALLTQVISWFIENEVSCPDIGVTSLAKFVEDAVSFAINYMYKRLSFAKIELSSIDPNYVISFFNEVIASRASILDPTNIKKVGSFSQDHEIIEHDLHRHNEFDEMFQVKAKNVLKSMAFPSYEGELNVCNTWNFIDTVATTSGCNFNSLAFNVRCHLVEAMQDAQAPSKIPFGDIILTCALQIFKTICANLAVDINSAVYWLQDEMNSLNTDEIWHSNMSEYYAFSHRRKLKKVADSTQNIVDMSYMLQPVNKQLDKTVGSIRPYDSLSLHLSDKKMSYMSHEGLNVSQMEHIGELSDCQVFHTHEIKLQCSQVLEDILSEKEKSDKFLQKLEDAVNFKNLTFC